MMNWEQLLSLKRFGDIQKRPRAKQDETRLGFEVDFQYHALQKLLLQ